MFPFEKSDILVALAELEREKKIREFYYPKAIAERKLTKAEADKRLDALNRAILILRKLLDSGLIAKQTDDEAAIDAEGPAKKSELQEVSLF